MCLVNSLGDSQRCLIIGGSVGGVSKSHHKSERLKNSTSHEEVKSERHFMKQFLREADLEELEDLKDYEEIKPNKEENIAAPAPIKKIIKFNKLDILNG